MVITGAHSSKVHRLVVFFLQVVAFVRDFFGATTLPRGLVATGQLVGKLAPGGGTKKQIGEL